MTFFKGHPLGFLHPVNIIKTLPNNEEKGLRASQLKKPAKPEKERVRGFKGSRGRVVLLESFFKSEKRKSQRIPNQRNQRNQIEGWKVRGLEGWQKTEVGRQKTEVRRQKSEVRRQKTEDRRQKTEDRRQKTEVRRQKSEVRSQKTEGWRCCKKSEKKGVEDLEKRSEKTLLTLHTLQAEGGRG